MSMWFKVAAHRFNPELVIYNAGTDILEGDPLGRLEVMSLLDLLLYVGFMWKEYFIIELVF